MPIKIPDKLPAREILENENIFVMAEQRAMTQDIRPLKIAILNLMPTKIETETQLLRLLGNSPLQVEPEFLQTGSYQAKHTAIEHLMSFYKTFDDVKDLKFDGLIITGAPVEMMAFEWITGTSSKIFFSGREKTYFLLSTSAGARRRGCTTITAFPNIPYRKRCSAYLSTPFTSRSICCCAGLTSISTRRIRATRKRA